MLLRAAAPKNWYKKNPQNLSFHITATHQLTQSDYLATLPNRVNSISKYLHSSTAKQRTDNSIRALMGSNLPSSLALYHTNMLFWPTWPRARCADGNQCQQQKNVKGQVLDFFGMLISKVSMFVVTEMTWRKYHEKWCISRSCSRLEVLFHPYCPCIYSHQSVLWRTSAHEAYRARPLIPKRYQTNTLTGITLDSKYKYPAADCCITCSTSFTETFLCDTTTEVCRRPREGTAKTTFRFFLQIFSGGSYL